MNSEELREFRKSIGSAIELSTVRDTGALDSKTLLIAGAIYTLAAAQAETAFQLAVANEREAERDKRMLTRQPPADAPPKPQPPPLRDIEEGKIPMWEPDKP